MTKITKKDRKEMNKSNEHSTEQYRFITGSLFEWKPKMNAYLHVYRGVRENTKRKAIAAYERSER